MNTYLLQHIKEQGVVDIIHKYLHELSYKTVMDELIWKSKRRYILYKYWNPSFSTLITQSLEIMNFSTMKKVIILDYNFGDMGRYTVVLQLLREDF